MFSTRNIDHTNVTQSMGNDSYSFVYVAHPRAVTHLSWRKTSKYMPKYVNKFFTLIYINYCLINY